LERIASDKAKQGYSAITNSLYTTPETINLDGVSFTRTTNIYEVSLTDLQTVLAGSGLKRVDITVTTPAPLNDSVKVSGLVGSYL
jgi:hypothetical protein